MFAKEMSSKARIISVVGFLVLAVCLGWAFKQVSAQAAKTNCKGAAALDPENLEACKASFRQKKFSPSLSSLPSPQRGPLRNQDQCSGGLRNEKTMKQVCYLGVSKSKAQKNIALIGDSHAAQWRPAMREIARQENWRIGSITASACNYRLPSGSSKDSSDCGKWRRAVPRWLSAHPEINTVIFSQVASGGKAAEAEVARGWAALPASIARIIVLRDSPRNNPAKQECIKKAVRRGKPPGPACATSRAKALPLDPAVSQAKKSDRQVIDMTDSFCSEKKCYSVLGGILVYADGNHQTPQFNRTTTPYLKAKLLKALGE